MVDDDGNDLVGSEPVGWEENTNLHLNPKEIKNIKFWLNFSSIKMLNTVGICIADPQLLESS